MAVRGNSEAAANYVEPDWETAVAKDPSDMQERFAEWLIEKAQEPIEGSYKIDLDKPGVLKAFRAGLILGTRFRMKFQASPENQKANAVAAKAKARDDEDDDEDETPKRKKATSKKAKQVEEDEAPAPKKAKGKAKAKPQVEEDDDEDEAPAPKAKAKSAASKGKRGAKAAF